MSAGEAGRHVVGFLDFVLDIFLEVEHKRYSQTLRLISDRLCCSWACKLRGAGAQTRAGPGQRSRNTTQSGLLLVNLDFVAYQRRP